MHRFLGRCIIGAGALLIATTASAQGTAGPTARPFKFGGSLGASVPMGDFADVADLGFHLGGLVEYKPASMPMTLRGELTYHRNSLKTDFFAGEDPIFGDIEGNASDISLLGNVVLPFGDAASTARPYAIAGVGVYRFKYTGEFAGFDVSDTYTDFGLNLGGGFSFNLSGFETFVEARFHSVFSQDTNTNFIPLSFGFKF